MQKVYEILKLKMRDCIRACDGRHAAPGMQAARGYYTVYTLQATGTGGTAAGVRALATRRRARQLRRRPAIPYIQYYLLAD